MLDLIHQIQTIARQSTPWVQQYLKCGWDNGGCTTFASALSDWSQGALEMSVIYVPVNTKEGIEEVQDHVLVQSYHGTLNLCWDAGGVATKMEALAQWSKRSNRAFGRIEQLSEEFLDEGLWVHPELKQRLVKCLHDVLGPYDQVEQKLQSLTERNPENKSISSPLRF